MNYEAQAQKWLASNQPASQVEQLLIEAGLSQAEARRLACNGKISLFKTRSLHALGIIAAGVAFLLVIVWDFTRPIHTAAIFMWGSALTPICAGVAYFIYCQRQIRLAHKRMKS